MLDDGILGKGCSHDIDCHVETYVSKITVEILTIAREERIFIIMLAFMHPSSYCGFP